MGLFSLTPRKASREDVKAPAKSRLSIRSVLGSKESTGSVNRAPRATPSATLKKSKSLTVMVNPPEPSSVPTGPCRYVAVPTKLGSGAYGAVLQGTDLCTSAPVAIKFIPDGRMRTSSLEREVSILERLSDAEHPSLVRFYGHVKPADVKAGEIRAEGTLPLAKPHTTCHALVMEMVPGGELFDYVVKREGLKETEAAPLFAQLCDAVHTAHALGITHRDLKLENVLLVRRKNAPAAAGSPRRSGAAAAIAQAASASIKLIDWGLAHQHAMTPEGGIVAEMLHSRCGSRSYMAPEVTNRDISGTVGYDGFAADVWSLGVCLFAMHLAFFPFEQANPEHDWRARRVIEAQRVGKSTMATILSFYPQKAPNGGLSPSLMALLDRMLIFNPKKRASLPEVLCSEWLAPHVPAACWAIAQSVALGLPRLHTRSGHSRSSSTGLSEGATPRAHVSDTASEASSRSSRTSMATSDAEPPLRASGRERVPQPLERQDSSGTTHTMSSVATASSAVSNGAPDFIPDFREPSAAAAYAALRSSARAERQQQLTPPPPSPLRESPVQHVVAGAAEERRERQPVAPPPGMPPGVDKLSLTTEMLTKACKVTSVGSPRRPDRVIDY